MLYFWGPFSRHRPDKIGAVRHCSGNNNPEPTGEFTWRLTLQTSHLLRGWWLLPFRCWWRCLRSYRGRFLCRRRRWRRWSFLLCLLGASQ